jgi:hypothetical protein
LFDRHPIGFGQRAKESKPLSTSPQTVFFSAAMKNRVAHRRRRAESCGTPVCTTKVRHKTKPA